MAPSFSAATPIPNDQDLKDEVHGRICNPYLWEKDPHTGCDIWIGGDWDEDGCGRIRVAGQQFQLHRVIAWVYLGGFDLFDSRVQVRHLCSNPACCYWGELDSESDLPPVGGHLLILPHGAVVARAA